MKQEKERQPKKPHEWIYFGPNANVPPHTHPDSPVKHVEKMDMSSSDLYHYWLARLKREKDAEILAKEDEEERIRLEQEKDAKAKALLQQEIVERERKKEKYAQERLALLEQHKKYSNTPPTVASATDMLFELLEIIQMDESIMTIDSALSQLSFPYSYYKAFLNLDIQDDGNPNNLMSLEDFKGLDNIYQRCLTILRSRIKNYCLQTGKSNALAKHLLEIEHNEFADIKKLQSNKVVEDEKTKEFYVIDDIKIQMN